MFERFLLCEKYKGKTSRGRRLEKQANKQQSVSKTIVDFKRLNLLFLKSF